MKHYYYAWKLLACSLILSNSLAAQKIISLKNPSFESEKIDVDVAPPGWNSFSAKAEGYPDLLTNNSGVNTSPQDGNAFLGLRTKRGSIFEGVTQKLSTPLNKNSVYQMSIWLAHASTYSVPVQKTGEQKGITSSPGITRLTVFGVNSATRKQELLVETTPVDHDEWRNYTLLLNPKTMNCDQLILTTQHTLKDPKQEGNLLLDNCSDIQLISSDAQGTFSDYHPAVEQPLNAGAAGQIFLHNPSFETFLYAQQPFPQFWNDKGAKNMSPPDVQPGSNYVTTSPQHGKYYLSMVARVDGTKEAIGQQLSAKMEKGASYSFSV